MDGNAYSRMIGVIRGENQETTGAVETPRGGIGATQARMRLAEVSGVDPLKIKVAGIEQPTENLRINERLIKGAKWKMKLTSRDASFQDLSGTLDRPVTCSGGHGSPQLGGITGGNLQSGNTLIDQGEAEQLEMDLATGDQVLVLTEDDQTFYILMKVVDAV